MFVGIFFAGGRFASCWRMLIFHETREETIQRERGM